MFQKTLRKNLEELIALEPEVDAFLAGHQTPAQTAWRVRLVLEELIRNVINHSPTARRIEVRLGVESEGVVVEIEDDGAVFDLRSVPEFDKSQTLEERRPGGMGIQLVRALAQEIEHQRLPSGNRLRLVVRTNAAPA